VKGLQDHSPGISQFLVRKYAYKDANNYEC
jgi:hypothetical protein